jgi:hypothetical protein
MNQTMIRKVFALLEKAARKILGHPRDALLSARMAFWVVLISVLAKLTTLPRVQKIAGLRAKRISIPNSSETPARLGRIIDGLLGIDLFVFRRSCWKRALVLHRYLALNGIESLIRFGLRKEPNGKVDGHAWLEHEGQPLLEDNAANYIVTFSLPAQQPSSAQSANYPRIFSATSEEGIAK